MTDHVITIERWKTERERGPATCDKGFVRWYCSCGRLGPALTIGSGASGRARAERRAKTGGGRHAINAGKR